MAAVEVAPLGVNYALGWVCHVFVYDGQDVRREVIFGASVEHFLWPECLPELGKVIGCQYVVRASGEVVSPL